MEPNSEAFEGPTVSIWIDFHLIEWAHDSNTNKQKNGQLSWVLYTQSLLLLYKGTTIWFWGGGAEKNIQSLRFTPIQDRKYHKNENK
jgi:hypothetical protein